MLNYLLSSSALRAAKLAGSSLTPLVFVSLSYSYFVAAKTFPYMAILKPENLEYTKIDISV